MKYEKCMYHNKIVVGIKLTAENKEDEEILNRFFDGGAKPNIIHPKGSNTSLDITFGDLIRS